ncbi:MAG: N-acetyltransferase [Phycisphaerae bacterium]|nr:N-acetyltransferase [Phycisphaerae bacterium]
MSSKRIILRPATRADLSTVARIYNYYVEHSTCTFSAEPEGPAYWGAWLTEHTGPYTAVVAARDGQIVGWGSVSKRNMRDAYRYSVEDSVYVEASCHGQGIGRTILRELVQQARAQGHHSMLAQIAGGQLVSERLHEGLGFRRVGRLTDVGFKFGRWIDVSIWQVMLQRDGGEEVV